MTTRPWIAIGFATLLACHADRPEPEAEARAGGLGACDDLGYAGTCVDAVSLWYEDGRCRVRNCAEEGRACGFISGAIGWGCLAAPPEAASRACDDLGYDGACFEGDVLAWAEDDGCHVVDCAARGQTCGWTSDLGWDCIGPTAVDAPAPVLSCTFGSDDACVGDLRVWAEGDACRLEDCASAGRRCEFETEGTAHCATPASAGAFDCTDVGYEGVCLSGDVLVWADTGACRWADCSTLGRACAWTETVGYDCVGDPEGGGLLTVSEIVGNTPYGISQDYGPTTFDGGYSYCQSYGSWGGQLVHCGVDITIPYGTPLFVPGNGTVLIAGESPYFEDAIHPAAGELRVQLEHDGAEVILGHMTDIALWTGQVVAAGQAAGQSGTMNGPHLHLEVRVPDGAYPLGFRTVDPMLYFGW